MFVRKPYELFKNIVFDKKNTDFYKNHGFRTKNGPACVCCRKCVGNDREVGILAYILFKLASWLAMLTCVQLVSPFFPSDDFKSMFFRARSWDKFSAFDFIRARVNT